MAKKTNLRIIGVDEAGRGPLAGPVVAGAVRVKKKLKVSGVNDSKKISPKKREELYDYFISSDCIDWGVGVVSEKVIDKINILEATKLAMKKALEKIDTENSQLIIDGNFKIDVSYPQKSVKRADETILECQIASIIAKVKRDKIMKDYHRRYPLYDFDKNKGYGTKRHIYLIKKHGPCLVHRKTFKRVLN